VKPQWNSLTPESRDANNGLDMQTTDVLVLEKDYASRATLCDVLLGAGLSVACACSEVEALAHLTTNTFRVALLDPSFPSRHGIQALRQRMKEMTPPGVVVITGTNTPELVLDALKTQAYDFVSTPIQADHLREVIQRALAADAALASFEVLCAGRKCVELSIPCARDAAERLEHFLNALEQDLEVGLQEAIRLAFRELLLNAVEWGGRLDAAQRVRVVRVRGRGMLVYRITDPGMGFRFDDLPHAAIGHQEDDAIAHMQVREAQGMRVGGFGLVIVRAIADELIYNERGNEVTFVKYLSDPAASCS
jgi:CheY-like chemotaxis protein/anti-sigma regulatory factor (Ser/Thr protein kinase)